MEAEDSFCVLVGPNSTGKSLALEKLGYALPNVVKLDTEASSNDRVSDALVAYMRRRIFTVPFPWCRVRLSSQHSYDIIENVFQTVRTRTNSPVTVLIDIKPRATSGHVKATIPVPGIWGSNNAVFEGKPSDILPLALNVENFTRDVKDLVSDKGWMQCAFVASEGLLFQYQAQREPRLHLFITSELSIPAAKLYLKKYHNIEEVNDRHLQHIPRTFSSLIEYAKAPDKDDYVEKCFDAQKIKVADLSEPSKKLLKVALTKALTPADYQHLYLSKEDVTKLVLANLLAMNESTKYEILFDVVRAAVQEEKC